MKTTCLIFVFGVLLICAETTHAQLPMGETAPVESAAEIEPLDKPAAKRPPKVDWPALPLPSFKSATGPGQWMSSLGARTRAALIGTYYALTPWREQGAAPKLSPPTGTRRTYSGSTQSR